jgi:hypothetical protein
VVCFDRPHLGESPSDIHNFFMFYFYLELISFAVSCQKLLKLQKLVKTDEIGPGQFSKAKTVHLREICSPIGAKDLNLPAFKNFVQKAFGAIQLRIQYKFKGTV